MNVVPAFYLGLRVRWSNFKQGIFPLPPGTEAEKSDKARINSF